MSLLYQLTRRLLSVPAVLLRHDISKDAELLVLRHENAVLRRQIPGQVRYESADRFWFAALSSLLARRGWQDIPPSTRDDPGLAPQVPRQEVGLQRAPTPDWTATHTRGHQEARYSPGPRQPALGPPKDPRRARRTQPPDHHIDHLGDSELQQASIPPHTEPAPPGNSSSLPRPAASSRQTPSTSAPRSAHASTPWSSSNTAHDDCTSPASSPTCGAQILIAAGQRACCLVETIRA
ncbi:hypothetical protein JOF56_009713 [Kibdelosporangium banguiense]|uniref:Uncharacterized protein n=1 Tax=Kibdelosporangium banguiense TaxID=1365924 RepID=A0ABS4TY49_9PSEU|nr:hypothetical protein [Kibdelosporangium banguiense]